MKTMVFVQALPAAAHAVLTHEVCLARIEQQQRRAN
jgi:hypothetical protein